ncbi:MAG: type II secretion system protein GspM [Eggerthellaceae bacterium]
MFSTSEKVLMLVLAVLLVVACYYFLVVKNVADTIAANEDRLADYRDQHQRAGDAGGRSRAHEGRAGGVGRRRHAARAAVYDNIRNELNELNALMGGDHVQPLVRAAHRGGQAGALRGDRSFTVPITRLRWTWCAS